MILPLPHLFLYLTSSSTSLSLSPLELLDLFISPINYLTFSSTSLSLSPRELPDLFISQLIAPPISYLNPVLRFLFSLRVVPMVLLLFESQRCVLFPLISDWFCRVSCFYLFLYLVFLFCSIFFFFWCSLFSWFYNFVVPKFFSRNVLIVVLTSFVFCCQYKWMLYNIILDIFPVHHTGLRLVFLTCGNMSY